jgi:hypothetical protein
LGSAKDQNAIKILSVLLHEGPAFAIVSKELQSPSAAAGARFVFF